MSDGSLANLEEFFLALSDGTRLRLLSLMQNGEVSVGYLSEKLDQSQPKISRHLAYLRSAGLVETRRDGKWIYYHIARPADGFASRSLNYALSWAGSITGDATGIEPATYVERSPETEGETRTLTETQDADEIDGGEFSEETYSNDIEVYLL